MSAGQKDEKSIFKAAVELKTTAERNAYLDKVCGDDLALKGRITALLQAHEDRGDFLEALLEDPWHLVIRGPEGEARNSHRPLQALRKDRRRWHGCRLYGRTTGAYPPKGGLENHQAGYGYQTGNRPF